MPGYYPPNIDPESWDDPFTELQRRAIIGDMSAQVLSDAGAPDPSEWVAIKVHGDMDGDWWLDIVTAGGDVTTLDGGNVDYAGDPDAQAPDWIWDIYGLADYLDIDDDKDIKTPGGGGE